jgi:glutathione S-transferase
MKLYWCPQTRALRGLWLLEEAGVPYTPVLANIREPQSITDPDFREASPMGKVPALVDGAVRIWDSGAISAYIADQYPQAQLAPPIGDPQRGAYLMWLMYTNAVIEPAMAEKASGAKPTPLRNGWGSFEQMLETLRKGVEKGPWVLGERFSAADVLLGMSCYYMRQFKMIQDEPLLFAYADRCAARPAFQRALAIESAALKNP